jgi:hypothetical protein
MQVVGADEDVAACKKRGLPAVAVATVEPSSLSTAASLVGPLDVVVYRWACTLYVSGGCFGYLLARRHHGCMAYVILLESPDTSVFWICAQCKQLCTWEQRAAVGGTALQRGRCGRGLGGAEGRGQVSMEAAPRARLGTFLCW